jgi:hypothetical protein
MIRLNSNTAYLWIKGLAYYCLALILLLLIVKVNHIQAQLLSICLLIIYLLVSSIHTYSFIVKDNCIEIRNQLRPFYKKSFKFDSIENIEIKGVINRGLTLAIYFKHQSKKYFAVTKIKKEELQKVIDEFKNYKEGNSK